MHNFFNTYVQLSSLRYFKTFTQVHCIWLAVTFTKVTFEHDIFYSKQHHVEIGI